MSRSFHQPMASALDKGFGRQSEQENDVAKKLGRLPSRAMDMAKAKVGEAVEQGIGDLPLKHFGDPGSMSKVCTGEKVPGYLARMYQDKEARRRFALALLEGDEDVAIETIVRIRRSA